MSTQYPDLTLTNFPSSVDQFMTFLNVVASDGPLIEQYLEAMNAGNQTQANQILAQIPQSSQKLITATDLNTLSQAMLAVERFYLTDIEPYMNELQQSWTQTIQQFSYQGVWSSGTSYVVNNLVSYTVSGINLVYIATSDPPVGTVPTNSNYWRLLTIQGQQGTSGQGVSYRQEWTNSATYSVDDCVTYNAALWMAIASSQNQEPTNNSQYWKLIMNLEVTTYPIQDTEPTNLQVNGLWFNTQENPTPYYYLEPLTNPITEEMVPVGYQAYTTNGVVLDGIGPLSIASGGTDASDSQNALNNLGAGVRPNLLDNSYFVGGGTGWGVFPVNQQNQTTYNTIGAMFDRWKAIYGGEWSVQLLEAGLQLTGGTPYASWVQVLRESLVEGEIYTLTALFSNGTLATGQVTAPASGTFSSSVYLTSGSYMRLNRTTDDVFEIIGAPNDTIPTISFLKAEHGSGQTAAYQKSDGTWAMLPQNLYYGRELLKCQQYLLPMGNISCVGLGSSSTQIFFCVPTPVQMRVKPVITGDLSVYPAGPSISSITVDYVNANSVGFHMNGTGITPNAAYSITTTNGFLSAQL